jgi:pilus assembly protein CpaB
VVSALVANEPITESKLAPREAGAGLPPMIPPGMRAMAVRVNDVIGVAGFAAPGTRVDVLVTVRDAKDSFSRTVLNNIQVLTSGINIDQEKGKNGQAMPTSVVTLLVTPQDGEKLTLAQNEGTIVLALRNPLDADPVETRGARMAALVGAPDAPPVRQVVRGQTRVVAPPPPPPPPKPYTVEAIRGAKRAEETVQ